VNRAPGGGARLETWAPDGLGEIRPGDDLGQLIADLLAEDLADGDIVTITSKIISKAEGRLVAATDREQAIDEQTVRVVATREHPGGVLKIVENPQGLVMAAAGVDASNTPEGTVLLLPVDPDASARRLRADLTGRLGVHLAVVITDTAGRAWRDGVVDIAIGAAGLRVTDDLRGTADADGRPLTATVVAVADEVATASELVRGKVTGRPVAVVRGLRRYVTDDDGPGAQALQRAAVDDLFRLGSDDARRLGHVEGYRAGYEAAVRETASGDTGPVAVERPAESSEEP
jgi:coenzyme F420-0:L-glutamate ligase / coenzyme F420-1:gamma-L-glutamate ligase